MPILRFPPRAARRPAFTLPEMLISISITTVVALACGSVIMMAGKTMTLVTAGPAAQTATANELISVILSDLRVATSFSERTSTAVTFAVPDRTGDAVPETLRYAWSGSAGATVVVSGSNFSVAPWVLFRQDGGGVPVPIGTNVRAFSFNFLLRTVGQPVQPPPATSSDQALLIHDGGSGSNIKNNGIDANNWQSEYFLPSWPANTVSWSISHVQVQLIRTGAGSGTVTVEIRTADSAKKPTTTVLGSATLNATAAPTTAGIVDFVFASPITGIDPAQGVCVVVKASQPSPAKAYYDNASADPSIKYCNTSNAGSSWSSPTTGNALQTYIYGTYTTQSPRPATPPEAAEVFE